MTVTTQGDIDGVIRLIRLLGKGSNDGSTCLRFADAKAKGPIPENNLDYPFTVQFEHVLKKRATKTRLFLDSTMPKMGIQSSTGISNNELEGA